MKYRVCIPSKGRAANITSNKIFKSARIYVPESEEQEYRGHNNVIPVPLNIKGITATRNHILKDNDCDVFFLDDDLQYFGYVDRLDESYKIIRMNDDSAALHEIDRMFDLMYQMGAKIGGFFTVGNNLTNYSYKPFQFNGVCLASCMAIINDGTYFFNEAYAVKEDYELSLRTLRDGRPTVRSSIMFMQHEHTQMHGGCRDSTRISKELTAIKKLNEEYPGWIQSVKNRGTDFSIKLNS